MFHVDKDKCTGCGACISVCPSEAISMVDDKAVIDESKCTDCGKCVQVCRPGAIYSSGQSGSGFSPGTGGFGRGIGKGGGRGLGRGPRDGRGGGRGGGGGRGR